MTPPADGSFRPSAENTAANSPDRHSKASQARTKAGPGLRGRETRQEQQARPEQGANIERCTARRRQVLLT